MFKILVGAAAFMGLAFAASNADARGGGPTPPRTSPYAILEPQTVAAEVRPIAPQALNEGRAAFEYRTVHCRPADRSCARRMRRLRATPW